MLTGVSQSSCSRVISKVFTLCGPKRPHGEKSLCLSNWNNPQEERERGIKRKRKRKQGGSGYNSSLVLEPTSRWAGNEAEDIH